MRVRTYLGTLSLAFALLSAACTPGVPSAGSRGDGAAVATPPKRVVAAIMDNPKFMPNSLNSGGGGRVRGGAQFGALSNAGLSTTVAPDAHYEAVLAEALPTVENDLWKVFPDGRMETMWRIRQGAAWHDGAPITGADYAFTATLSQDRDMPWLPDKVWQYMDQVEAPDAQSVKVTWKSPYIRADQTTFNPLYPKHILEEPYAKTGAAIASLPFWNAEYIGTGPFKLKEWVTDQHATLTAFDKWVFGRPKLDELEVRFIPDSNTLVANMLAGTVQFTLGDGLSIEQGIQARDRWTEGTMIPSVAGDQKLNVQFLNPDPPILANVNFRKALYIALDRQAMVDQLMYGVVKPLDSGISTSDPEYKYVEPQIVRYPYDPRKAAQMIEDLGFRKGADGMYVDQAGKPLVVQIAATTDDTNAKPQAVALDMWKQIGITPDLDVITEQKNRDLEYRANFKSLSLQAGQTYHADGFACLHSREMRTVDKKYVGCNYDRFSDPLLDAMIDRYFVTIPFNERMQILGQMTHFATDQLTQLGLYERATPTLVSNQLSNIGGLGYDQTWNAQLWDTK